MKNDSNAVTLHSMLDELMLNDVELSLSGCNRNRTRDRDRDRDRERDVDLNTQASSKQRSIIMFDELSLGQEADNKSPAASAIKISA